MKAVISDSGWHHYIAEFKALVATEWSFVVAADHDGELAEEIADADALIASSLPAEARAAARKLRLFQFPGAGVQHMKETDVPAGCALCNVYGHEVPIAEYVMTVMLLHVTQLARYAKTFRRGSWDGSARSGGATHDELYGKSVGLIGFGHIGREVAVRALAFGMRVSAICQNRAGRNTRSTRVLEWLGGPADLDRLLENADFVIVACALSNLTRGMLGSRQLAQMKTSAVLVNVARAEIIDETALFEALRDRHIAGAALDAWYRYPASEDNMLHGSRLPFHELPNVIVTPHMSGWSSGTVKRRQEAIGHNLDRLARNEPLLNVVLEGNWRAD